MKSRIVIVAAFLSLIIIDSSIGRVYMPDWAYAITIVVLIVCFVYYIFKMIYNGKTRLEEGQYALTSNITNTKFEIEKKLNDQKISFLDSLLEKQNALLQAIKECSEFVDKESAKRTELAMNRMSTMFDEIGKKIQKETEEIEALEESLKSFSTQILEKVVSENDKVQKNLSQIEQNISRYIENTRSLIGDTSARLTSLTESRIGEVEKAIEDNYASLVQKTQEHSDSLTSRVSNLAAQATSSSNSLLESLAQILKESDSLSTQILEKIVSENDKSLNHLSQIAQSINSNSENTRSLIDGTSTKLTSLTESLVGGVEKAIEDNYASLVQKTQEHSDSLTSRVSNLAAQATSSSNSLLESLAQILKEADSHSTQILEKVVSENDKVQKNLSQIEQNISRYIENTRSLIGDTSARLTSLTESRIGEVEKAIEDNYASLVQKTQEHSDSLTSRVSNLAAQATSSSNSLLESLAQIQKESDSLKSAIDGLSQQNSTLQDIFNSGTTQLSEKVENAVNTLVSSIDEARKSNDDTVSHVLQKGEENTKAVNHAFEDVKNQYSSLHGQLTAATIEFTAKVKNLNDVFTLSLKEAKDNFIQECTNNNVGLSSQLLKSVQEESGALSSKIDTLGKQNQGFIKGQCDVLQKELGNIQNNTSSLVSEIGKLSTKNNNDSIVNSIKSLISGLKIELQKDVENVNKQVIDTRSLFQTTNNEVQKLQTLLNIVLKSSEDNKRGISELTSINSGKPTSTTGSSVYSSPVSSKPELKPNRTETIVDSETGNTVLNKFERNVLVKSTMNNKAGRVIYEIEYNNGQIVRSKNFDTNGKLTIEQTYYDNNQVHFRYEYTKNGRITTEFDKFGNKK